MSGKKLVFNKCLLSLPLDASKKTEKKNTKILK